MKRHKPKDIPNNYCRRCHKKLSSKKSLERGYGPDCYKKHLAEKQKKKLF